MKKIIIAILSLLLAFCLGMSVGYLLFKNEGNRIAPAPEVSDTLNWKPDISKENSLLPLQQTLEEQLKEFDGVWAVYVEDLSGGDVITINDSRMVSASLIKLFVMGKVFEEIENGTIKLEDVQARLDLMITVSDNEATNELVAILGGGTYTDMKGEAFQNGLKAVNSYVQKLGFSHTEQQRDLKDSRPQPIPEDNFTSVSDCGKFLSALYRKELVSEAADTKMLDILLRQTRTGKIPAGLPEGTVCANKTGELRDTENDAAIVFSPGGDYVICVMSTDVPDTAKAREQVAHLSQTVYKYFNED